MTRETKSSYRVVHNTKLKEAETKIEVVRNNYLRELLQLRRKYSKIFVKIVNEYIFTCTAD